MHEMLKSHKNILVEGANAMLLDIDFGKDTNSLSLSNQVNNTGSV